MRRISISPHTTPNLDHPSLMPMELLQISSFFPLFFTFLLFLSFIFAKFVKGGGRATIYHHEIPKLPPGPKKLPIIGNLHQLSGALPHHALRNLAKKYGPIMHLQLGEISLTVFSSADAAKEVLKTHDLAMANRPELLAVKIIGYGSTDVIFAPYGQYWRQLRKICVLELLTVKRVQSYRSIREELVGDLIAFISSSSGRTVNLSEKLFKLTNDITSRVAFGKKCKDGDVFIAEITKGIEMSSGFDVHDVFPSLQFLQWISRVKPALEEIHRKMDKILEDIINEHKAEMASSSKDKSGKEDLVDVLLKAQERGDLEVPITTNNIKAVILDIFTAGSETSSTVISWAMSEMLRNPRVMEKAQAEVRQVFRGKSKIEETSLQELSYLKLVIKETLRLHPPLPLLLPREVRERCVINGYEVPIKTKVMINAWAIGRDPEHWTNADCFEPERFSGSAADFKGANFEYIPFGGGRRICPGITFGITNVELPLANLLYHFDWKPADGIKPEELDMTEAFGSVAKRKNDLYLTAIPYLSLKE